jgi:hypothetical protein
MSDIQSLYIVILSLKSYECVSHVNKTNIHTHRQTDRQTDRKGDTHTNTHILTQTHTEPRTYKQTESERNIQADAHTRKEWNET